MKRTTKRTNKTAVAVTPKFAAGSARVYISDVMFGGRFLGGSDPCIFRSEAAARAEIEILRNNGNSRVIDEWEIQVYRANGDWVMTNAGEFTPENAPGRA